MISKILLVDDDRHTINLFQTLFRKRPETLEVAPDAASARRRFRGTDFNLILMDQRLPDGNGLDLIQEMRRERPYQITIMITGYADVRDAVRAVREGTFDYLTKPFDDIESLETTIDKALELDRAYREIDNLRRTLDGRSEGQTLIGQSPAIEQLLQQIQQVAALDTTVLLEGESGTGKELVSRLLHASSPRATGPFLAVNCGALSEQLLESTLFGYEKGAFTGAVKTTAGYLEQADGGTLFLDEVADMSAKLQSSLLRVLQERRFNRLGGTGLRSSDFRLICACNRCLADEVRNKLFREDLYYRINVVALRIPPLRERHEDILALALYFLELFNRKFGKEVGPFTPDAIRLLEQHPWPGNVRQLRHAIERLVALHPGGPVGNTHLEHLHTASDAPCPPAGLLKYDDERAQFERAYLERLLDAANGNVSEAARISGVARQNLYERMKRWGLS
ncbi:MAG: sigma-54-dependent Fis family transcriptional regulator [Gammaproteobacteria bacterium]|nr:sigma-54-dependent Fis family transcriptional regulator [Gammaproteobacteria bacterium]